MDPRGKLDIGELCVALQLLKNPDIGGVKR
jgi:hypothetical protein